MKYLKKFRYSLLFIITLSASLVFLIPLVERSRKASRSYAATAQAFTLRQHYQTIGPHGDRIVQNIIFARLNDGSSVKETDSPMFGWFERTIYRPTGVVQHAFDEVKTVSSVQEDSAAYLAHFGATRDPSSDCTLPFGGKMMEPDKLLGQENIGGVLTDKVQVGLNSGLIAWYAPSLGCVALQHVRTYTDSTSKLVFDRLSFDEPDPKLFAIGSDYQELPPSQSTLKHLQYGHVPEANISQIVKNLAKSDVHYAANRVTMPQ